ncbi:hypothetical protein TNCV_4697771 [Trichonephila clavipes]|nr:hypothetical protein TNCV_4697771 [Trichonephila clavipes]
MAVHTSIFERGTVIAVRYRAHLVNEFLESGDICRLDWPFRSPDLIPIEHAWDALGMPTATHTLFENHPRPKN